MRATFVLAYVSEACGLRGSAQCRRRRLCIEMNVMPPFDYS
jgi:hypothetical protein